MASTNRREFLAAVARLGLLAGVAGDPAKLFAAGQRRMIRGRVVSGDKPLGGVLAYDAPNGSTAEARIDEGPWQPMPAYKAQSVTTPDLTMPHHFRLAADTTSLQPGRHAIAARVRWPDGTVITETAAFAVDSVVSRTLRVPQRVTRASPRPRGTWG